ncbi:hypothetical protein EHS13_00580 [Paenibacillus psychroresistens]|uniref:Uncharacterized protein n=1 Tax=Paenibacillus psychroresistens TaxID=1778678 RepID=A0A6B8RD80_9BACL|nr:hypothetical protein [Paenibacillus psychroresistens]QGQ93523.1 hypothetical protein EHS13_00580 [Paenibacillus psychroresistens]
MIKIYILDEVWEYSNHVNEIVPLFSKLNDLTNKADLVIQQIIIDDTEITGDFMDYLSENIDSIDEIHIQVIDKREMLDEMLVTSSQYLTRALPEMTLFINQLYQGLNDLVWNKFSVFIEGLQYVIYTLDSISQSVNRYTTFPNSALFLQELNLVLQQLMEASINKDNALMADILNYELKPHLEKLQGLFTHTIDSEVKRNDLQ